jgi:excisionase family DNA binding protein
LPPEALYDMAITSRAVPSMETQTENHASREGDRPMPADDECLTVGDVADRLRVHPQTVRAWIARGDLRAIRIGRTVRVRQTDFQEMLERARIPPRMHAASPHPGDRAGVAR